jgi:hypothetical protein
MLTPEVVAQSRSSRRHRRTTRAETLEDPHQPLESGFSGEFILLGHELTLGI